MNVFDIFNKQSPIKGKHLKEDSNMPVAVDSTSPIHGFGEDDEIDEHIGKVKDGYRLYSRKGKNLGTFPNKAGAEKHEREVQYFKHANEDVTESNRNYDDNRTGFGRPPRDMSDESNMMYRYDTADGKLKQRMIGNPQRQQANNAGFRDTPEQALRAHNIIRSKFDANKYVQKQGAKWVPVYPYGQQGMAEGWGNFVSFEVDSENAYNQVMKKFGDVIDWHGNTMVAPRKYWGSIQELAHDAGGEAIEVGNEHVAEGSETPEKELERLKLRQNAEHGHASLKRQAETQARIRELEKQIKDQQGVAEGSQRVDSLVTDALKIMQGSEVIDAVRALKIVLGDREYNDRRGHYSFYVRQMIDMYNQQHMSEEKVRLDPKCWTGKKIGNPKTKMKGGVRVNNCVPAESVAEGERTMSRAAKGYEKYGKAGMQALAKAGREGKDLDKVRDKYNKYDESVEEGWKSALAGAALAGATALGGAGAAQAADLSSFNTQYLQQVANGEHPRPMVSVDDARAELQARTNGKQQTVTPEPKPQTPSGYSIDYLKKAADPERTGRYLISVEKAQELLKQATVKEQSVAEDTVDSPIAQAITRRILLQRTDLLSKYGPELVTQAIDEVADYVGDAEEIGSSDVSGWIKQVEQMLANNPPEAFGVAENKKEVEYDAEWDEKVRRVGQMAKEGPRKTVWDPVKRVYKTVPVNSPREEISNDVLESRLYAMKRAGYDIV